MRAAVNLLVVSSLVLAAGVAEAQWRRVLRAEITGVEVDPDSFLGDVKGGVVVIDRVADEIQLELYRADEGGDPEEPEIIEILLPVTSVRRNGCGGIVYTAERDARPVDGPLERIELTDNRFLRCRILLPPTQIEYTHVSSGFGAPVSTTRAYFTAGRLRSVFVRQ